MADDIFGDESLFSEFNRSRDTQNIFIHFEKDESGTENRSRIVFRTAESDSSDDEDDNETETGYQAKEVSKSLDSGQLVTDLGAAEESQDGNINGQQSKTSYQEQFEKNKYRDIAKIIDSTRCVEDEQSPGVQIIFQNNKFAKKYRSRIEQFIISLTEHADKKDFSRTATDLSARQGTVATCVDINDKLPTEKRNDRMWQAHGIIGCAQFHDGFMVDSRGWPQDADEVKDEDIPKYFQVFDEIFPPKEEETGVPEKPKKQKNSCFNCGEEHRLSECQAPRDHNRIRQKRREHQDRASKKGPSNTTRYHEDPELNPTKVKFEAGVISPSLREAMGLKSDQLPSYLYRMRQFGYPPGWLMAANRKATTLAMYDKDGHETDLRGESLEDGEYGDQASNDPAEVFTNAKMITFMPDEELFDVSKIIEYPGFTVPVPQGFVDECQSVGMPPIQEHQLKKTLMEDVTVKEMSKKRRLEEDEVEKRKKLKGGEDMEIEDEDEAAQPVCGPAPRPASKAGGKEKEKEEGEEEEGESKEEGESSKSPSMDSLQQEYKDLVNQLNTPATPQQQASSSSSSSVANGNKNNSARASSSAASASDDKSPTEVLREKNFSFTSSSSSISRDYGTPILVREKSFRALPSPDKFGVGIEDHIPFENLPDSAGTFDKMKSLFSLIKNKVKGIKK